MVIGKNKLKKTKEEGKMEIIFGWIDESGIHNWLMYHDLESLLDDKLENYDLQFSILNDVCFNFEKLNDLVLYVENEVRYV